MRLLTGDRDSAEDSMIWRTIPSIRTPFDHADSAGMSPKKQTRKRSTGEETFGNVYT